MLSLEPNKAHFFFQENVTDPVWTVDFPRFYPMSCHRITINLFCVSKKRFMQTLFCLSYELLKFRERAIITCLMEGHLWLWKYPRKTLHCILYSRKCRMFIRSLQTVTIDWYSWWRELITFLRNPRSVKKHGPLWRDRAISR